MDFAAAPANGHATAVADLRDEVDTLRRRVLDLEAQLGNKKQSDAQLRAEDTGREDGRSGLRWEGSGHALNATQVERYSRHIVMHSFGVQAQSHVCAGSVLVIGAGGLGCPAAIYLAAAGVGRIGLCDKDTVDSSNLHRQVLHRERDVGMHKADSAAAACRAVNSEVEIESHRDGFLPSNALSLVERYDVIVDASDNAPTRYLASDACCIARKPLVSGAAIGTDGQLSVYNHDGGPCYRCLFPDAPRPDGCSRCSEAGVLGPVPGVIGTLQALETLKLLSGKYNALSQRLLVADFSSGSFMTVKLRPKQASCPTCGTEPSITRSNLAEYDYQGFTGQGFDDKGGEELRLLPEDQRISGEQLFQNTDAQSLILDVRPLRQFEAAHLKGSYHVPFDEQQPQRFEADFEIAAQAHPEIARAENLTVVCRRGNDSQRVVGILGERFGISATDLRGGLVGLSSSGTSPQGAFPLL